MWSNELELKFIELFHSEPILWDAKHRHYKDKSLNHDAWNRLAELMKIPVPELKKKKESLFASYRKYRKMVKDSCKSGAGEDEVYKPVWFAYGALDLFLGDGLTPRTQINTTSNTEQVQDQHQQQQPGTSGNEEGTIRNETRTLQTGRPRSQLQCEVKEAGKQVKEAINLFQESIRKRDSQALADDCEIYAMGLAKKLRAFTEEERLEIMYHIDGMIINRRRAKNPERFLTTPPLFTPPSRPSSTMSCHSEPLLRNVGHRHNTRIVYSEPPQIHIPEEQNIYHMYPESPQNDITQNTDAQTEPNVRIISDELLEDSQLSTIISKAYKYA